MKFINEAINHIYEADKLSQDELEDILKDLAIVRDVLSERYVTAIDHLVDDLLRYKYPGRVADAIQARQRAREERS